MMMMMMIYYKHGAKPGDFYMGISCSDTDILYQ